MTDLSKQIKEELSAFTVTDKLIENTIKKARLASGSDTPGRHNKWFTAAAVFALCLLISGSAFAGVLVYQNIYINGEAIPELDAMKAYRYYEVNGLQSSGTTPVIYSKEYDGIRELIGEIHKSLLLPAADDTEYRGIYYETDKTDYEYIRYEVSAVIGTREATLEAQIFIALSENQLRRYSQDLLGGYTFEDEVMTENGDRVITASSGAVNRIIFAADGILYQFDAPVSSEQLLEYVNKSVRQTAYPESSG